MDKPLACLTAADLMSRDLVLVPQEMSLQGAAHLLSRSHVSGAPVVDEKRPVHRRAIDDRFSPLGGSRQHQAETRRIRVSRMADLRP